ncbi:MAG: ATP-binding cassette domain-containing protein [Marinifilaceae bacterium]|nr:ATP-binding cassette domain-containing protein [Marinifilaceae bacterium]
MEIHQITIQAGIDKLGNTERLPDLRINKGEIYGIVGPTGSGKSQLIADIEQLAQGDTASKRKILINGAIPSHELRSNPRKKMVAQLSQNMNFFADMPVADFLKLHARCRGKNKVDIKQVISIANTLTGEPINAGDNLTILSGGQTRALMVADVAIISESPIVLIDEIENAGIKKHEALQLLSGEGKIILVVTHDPVLALSAQKRIIMRNGGMRDIIESTYREKQISLQLNDIDQYILTLREDVRAGKKIEEVNFDALLQESSFLKCL